MDCIADGDGALTDCKIAIERSRAGFGEALRSLAPRFRVLPFPQAQAANGSPVVITATWPQADVAADWSVQPKAGDFETTSTLAAARSPVPGRAVMNCFEARTGALHDCMVIYQDPPGKGFGTMALRFQSYLKLKPAMLDGRPLETGINIAMTFGGPNHASLGTVTPPYWLAAPGASTLMSYYPPKALSDGISGIAVIQCMPSAEGSLSGCVVVAEAPRGAGFGDAAVAAARDFQISPAAMSAKQGVVPWIVPILFSANMAPASWPVRAWREKVSGSVQLSCKLDEAFNPRDCQVKDETPPGYGFGDFAIANVAAQTYKTKPDGSPLHSGETISIPVHFRLPGPTPASSDNK